MIVLSRHLASLLSHVLREECSLTVAMFCECSGGHVIFMKSGSLPHFPCPKVGDDERMVATEQPRDAKEVAHPTKLFVRVCS